MNQKQIMTCSAIGLFFSIALSPVHSMGAVYSGYGSEEYGVSFLSPHITISNLPDGLFNQTEPAAAFTTIDQLQQERPDLYAQIAGSKQYFQNLLSSVDERTLQQPNNTLIGTVKKNMLAIEDMARASAADTGDLPEYRFLSDSNESVVQERISGEFLSFVRNVSGLNEQQQNILMRWAEFSVRNLKISTAVLPAESADQLGAFYNRVRIGYQEIIALIKQYNDMLQRNDVNPDAVQLRLRQDDTTSEVRVDRVGDRRAHIASLPIKADPLHLGHLITMLNAVVYGKVDKLILLTDNFDARKPGLTSLVMREIEVKVLVDTINSILGKEVVVYAPWMRYDQTFQPDGEHILPQIIQYNAAVSRDAVTNAKWSHVAGGDHQGFTYSLKKDAGLDTVGKIAFLRRNVRSALNLSSDDLAMGIIFNGRPGEVAPQLLTQVQSEISGLDIITSVQHLQISSTDIREAAIWAFLPFEIAAIEQMLHVASHEPPEAVGPSELSEQLEKAGQVIDYLANTLFAVGNPVDSRELAELLTGLRGIGLQEVDSFLSFNRNALIGMRQQAVSQGTVELKQFAASIPDKQRPRLFGRYQDFSRQTMDVEAALQMVEAARGVLFSYVDSMVRAGMPSEGATPVAAQVLIKYGELAPGIAVQQQAPGGGISAAAVAI